MKFQYIQHEKITLTGNSEDYRIEMDKRFKYCSGIAIIGQATDFDAVIGVKDSKEWLLNKIPFAFIPGNFSLQKKSNYIIPQNFEANGNIIYVYFDCTDYSVTQEIEIAFFLTNEIPVDNEFDYIFHFENISSWDQSSDYSFNLNLDSLYKNLRGISSIIDSGSGFAMNELLFSIRDNVSTYLYRVAGEFLENFDLPVNDNFLPIQITNNKNIEAILKVKGTPATVSGNICLIFQVENRKLSTKC